MTSLHIVSSTSQPPNETAWEAMCSNPRKYAPLIERVVGYMLFIGYRDDEDRIGLLSDDFMNQEPALAALSEDEQYFVHAGASLILFEDDPGFDVRRFAAAWMSDGGPQ